MYMRWTPLFVFVLFGLPFAHAQVTVSEEMIEFDSENVSWRQNDSGSVLVKREGGYTVRLNLESKKFRLDSGEIKIMYKSYMGSGRFGNRMKGKRNYLSHGPNTYPLALRDQSGAMMFFPMVNRHLNGPFYVFQRNGDTIAVYNYLNGEKHGDCIDLDWLNVGSKVLWQKEQYQYGKRHGECIYRTRDSGLKTVMQYDHGLLKLQKEYDSGQRLRRVIIPYISKTTYDAQGRILSQRVRNYPNYSYSRYDTAGNIRVTGSYFMLDGFDSVGTWRFYNEKGVMTNELVLDTFFVEEPEETNEVFEWWQISHGSYIRGGTYRLAKDIENGIKIRRRENGQLVYLVRVKQNGQTEEVTLVSTHGKVSETTRQAILTLIQTPNLFEPMSWLDKNLNSTLKIAIEIK